MESETNNSLATSETELKVPSPPYQTSKSPAKKPNIVGTATLVLAVIALLCSSYAIYSATKITADKQAKQQAQLDAIDQRVKALEEADKYTEKQVDKDKYQAVFLQGGQVYFGKITAITKDTMKLEEIYYLKTGNVDKSGNPVVGEDISLVKLGHELHSPEDAMYIERKNVTFWENLQNDGQVAQAIANYKASN